MSITDLAIRRPTFIVMAVLLVLGLGVLGYVNLGANLFPTVNIPIVSVSDIYVGAGAQEIEREIIKPIEDAVSGISGIDKLRSTAVEGFGAVVIQFSMATNSATAAADVQKAVDGLAGKLPSEADRPVVVKFGLNDEPILILSVSGTMPFEELNSRADTVRKALENIDGVGNVTLQGDNTKELSVALDKSKLDFYGISVQTVTQVLRADNLNLPAGIMVQESTERTVRVLGAFAGVEEAKNLRIPTSTGGNVRLADIADVELKYPRAKTIVRMDGKSAIGISVVKRGDANIVTTTKRILAALPGMTSTLPPGTVVDVARDMTLFINQSLDETQRNLIEAIIMTSIVLFLFLRDWRSSLIVLVTIPVCLISTFFMMFLFKFSLNILTLMALVLCIGILVDDSIVILENIHRHIKMGKDPRRAAIEGRKEIAMAAIAITLCDVVVFAPMAFMTDLVGTFFREFGFTVVFSTLVSLIVSFTLTPLMAARMLGRKNRREEDWATGGAGGPVAAVLEAADGASGGQDPVRTGSTQGAFGRFFEVRVKGAYRRFLEWSLRHRLLVTLVILALLGGSVSLIPLGVIQTEFIPKFDQGRLMIAVSYGSGLGIERIDARTKEIEDHLMSMPEVADVYAVAGSVRRSYAATNINVKLTDQSKRKKKQAEIAKELRDWGKRFPDADLSVTEPSIMDQTSIEWNKPLILTVSGPDRGVITTLAGQVERVVAGTPGVVDVTNSVRSVQTEYVVMIDRLAVSSYGLTTYDIAIALRAALSGIDSGVFRTGGDDYGITVSFRGDQMRTPIDLGSIKISNPMGQRIPLSLVASFVRSEGLLELTRQERQNVATIQGNLEGRVLGAVTGEITPKLAAIGIPHGYAVKLVGDTTMMTNAFGSLVLALAASVTLVFMILVVLYGSYLTPVIRMLSLPCGIIGGLVALAITGKALGILTLIGIIMLDGLASKNGTLLIDYTNTLMKRGMSLRDALVEAGLTRLRPIVMTSATMIGGMLPLALALGAGSEIKSGMAVVLVGGLLTSTLLSPIFLPVAYTVIDDIRHLRLRRGRKT
jgi:hydrophobic/amphiphilic exporter-1 (mainly G- bacteria), HAE1 family